MLPEARIIERLEGIVARMRVVSLLWALAAAGAAFAALAPFHLVGAAMAAVTTMMVLLARARTRWTVGEAAGAVERETSRQNLVITAAELLSAPKASGTTKVVPYIPNAAIRLEILRQADEALRQLSVSRVEPLARPLAVAAAVLAGCGIVVLGATRPVVPLPGASAASNGDKAAPSITAVHVRVTPPAYVGLPEVALENPLQVPALAGSTIHLAIESSADSVQVIGSPEDVRLSRSGSAFVGSWIADRSMALALKAPDGSARFLSLEVTADRPPTVRVMTPGKDLAVAPNAPPVPITIEGGDDLGLRSLTLRYVLGSGGGESMKFTEGEVPLTVTRSSGRSWSATAQLALRAMKLSAGDVVVYRAIARDTNPAGEPVPSESFIVEVGTPSEVATSGFALPAEERKYAISQQMVIYKTEQLMATRAQHLGDLGDQSRMLAIEQRMVRSEIVFLGGGEVQDEEVEAASSDELAEGRLQNTGRAAMLGAINQMSRAEAELNGVNLPQALVFERAALKLLESAFDRRRFFLKTLTERARIDPGRRLTGDLKDARSWTGTRGQSSEPELAQERSAVANLARALDRSGASEVDLAAMVSAVDSSSSELQRAALALASATTATREQAIRSAMRLIALRAVALRAPSATPVSDRDPLAGRLADQLAKAAKGTRP